MQKKRSIDKSAVILGLLTTISALFSSHTAYYLFSGDFTLTVWSAVFGIFLAFYRFGNTKIQHINYVSLYTALTYALLLLLSFTSLLPQLYYSLFLTLIIFCCLCTHRYIRGGRGPSIFLVVYLLLFLLLYPHGSLPKLSTLLTTLSLGLLIPYLFTVLFILILPTINIPIAPADKDSYLIKLALRITIILNIAFITSTIFNVTNTAWICFSILVVNEVNIGSSVKKAGERLLGTFLGGIVGIIIAHLIFQNYFYSFYLCFILIFFTYYFIARSYTLGIALATVWIAASFYLLKPAMSINQFIFARIADTLIGICLGLLGALLIFPKSFMVTIRDNFSQVFFVLHEITQHIAHESELSSIHEKIQIEKSLFSELTKNIKIVNYEPLIHISKRYGYLKMIYTISQMLFKNIHQFIQQYPVSQSETVFFNQLSNSLLFLCNITPKLSPNQLLPLIQELQTTMNTLKNSLNNPRSRLLNEIFDNTLKLLQLYAEALSTPYWLPKWKSIKGLTVHNFK